MMISSHFHSGIFSGCSKPAGRWCSALTLWQLSHRATYSATSRFIPYHQLSVFVTGDTIYGAGHRIDSLMVAQDAGTKTQSLDRFEPSGEVMPYVLYVA